MNMRLLSALLLVASLVVAGCDSKTATPSLGGLKKLEIKDTVVGKGPVVERGDTVWVRYTGKLKDGKEFDSNAKGDKPPFQVVVGTGGVIQGWDEGLVGIREGGKRSLAIPAEKGYGPNGQGDIPPNSDLYFDIEAIKVLKPTDTGQVSVEILSEGSGRAVKDKDTITIEYVAKDMEGKEFMSSKKEGAVTFKLGNNELYVNGLEAGILQPPMKVGGKRKIMLPPPLGVPAGLGGLQGPTVQTFEVTLKSIK